MDVQHPAAGRGALLPPPGFEAVAGLAPAASSPSAGLSLAPASDSPASPPSPRAGSPISSLHPEAASSYSYQEKDMNATNTWLMAHHHTQVVAMMEKKFQDLLDYDRTKNRKVLHLDWVAGNPEDPAKKAADATANDGLTDQERAIQATVAKAVKAITFGNEYKDWDESKTWTKTFFYGDWLNNERGFRQYFLEIQVKRISGADEAMLQECGISPEFAWLSLHDTTHPGIEPIISPPLFPTARALPAPPTPPAPSAPVDEEVLPTVEQEEYAAPAPASPTEKGKGKAVDTQGQSNDDRRPIIVSSESAQSPKKRTPLPNAANLALRQLAALAVTSSPRSPTGSDVPLQQLAEAATTASPSPSAGPSVPRVNLPQSETHTTAGSSTALTVPTSDDTSTSSSDSSEGSVYLAEGEDPFDTLIPAHVSSIDSAAELARSREHHDLLTSNKRAELNRVFACNKDPAFIERKKNSFIYAVRVIAIPDRGDVTNMFSGPPVNNRYGTLLAQGGWVVPPMEERIAYRDAHARAVYRNKGARPGKYGGPIEPNAQNAMPFDADFTGSVHPRYYGPPAPLWREVCDPTLEDVYWMVWQMLAGKQFMGFRPGFGFGVTRNDVRGNPDLLEQCPFRSPSAESLYHTASYPRGKEI